MTPHIGVNGNWYIGVNDTGIPAEGQPGADGQDGYTPVKDVDYFDGEDGLPGADGREVELSVVGDYIVWRYLGEGTWNNLVTLASITGPPGADGEDGAPGAPGIDGKQIEVRENAGWVEWRYVGDATWTQLYEIPTGGSGGDTFLVHLKFEEVGAIVYTVPYACKFTSMIHQQANTPSLSTALNTNMAQYDDLTVTPDAIGLVTLEGIWL